MDKKLVIKNAKKKFKGNFRRIVLDQIELFFDELNSDYKIKNNYKVGDYVKLNNNHLLHGIGKHVDIIDLFCKRGIVSQDYLDDNSNHAFSYVSAFWTVDNDILLKDYIKNYSGIIAKVNDSYKQVPYGELDNFVEKMKDVDHWLWTGESSMEIRFMPSLARDINQVGFILNLESENAKKLRSNSVFKDSFNRKYALKFVKKKDEFKKNGFVSDFFFRADYIIFGLPKNYIEGILVGRNYEKNEEKLNYLKVLFPNCYICNLDGKVIR